MASLPRFRLSLAALVVVACGRSGLEIDDLEPYQPADPDAGVWLDGAPPSTGGAANVCQPTEEICNGVDDDCDGDVDEVPAIPCADGGAQYCVSGAYSECPERCETCMPGSERICFLSYCKYWAVQTCTADGKSFGKCHELDPPPECASIAKNKKYSKELEQCCLDNDYCCVDDFDLDDDGNTYEMIGRCEEVACEP